MRCRRCFTAGSSHRQTPECCRSHYVPTIFFAQGSQATFAFHLDPAMPLTGNEIIGIGTMTGNAVAVIGAGREYDLQDATTEVVTFVPHDAIGPQAHGPLRFCVVGSSGASRWAPLGTAVRLPNLQGVPCAPAAGRRHAEREQLFLLQAIAANDRYEGAQTIPDGCTASTLDIALPKSSAQVLFRRLRDATDATGIVAIPQDKEK